MARDAFCSSRIERLSALEVVDDDALPRGSERDDIEAVTAPDVAGGLLEKQCKPDRPQYLPQRANPSGRKKMRSIAKPRTATTGTGCPLLRVPLPTGSRSRVS